MVIVHVKSPAAEPGLESVNSSQRRRLYPRGVVVVFVVVIGVMASPQFAAQLIVQRTLLRLNRIGKTTSILTPKGSNAKI